MTKPHTRKLPVLMADNPFPPPSLPAKMTWTSSSVSLFRACKRKWFWKYICGIRPSYGDANLAIGKAFHATLGEWYRGRRSDMRSIATRESDKLMTFLAENGQYFDQDDYDKSETKIATFGGMMMGYGDMYAKDRENWEIDRERIEAVFHLDMGEFFYDGRIDLIARQRGKKFKFQVEHKTASSITQSYVDRLALDTQIRGYVMGCKEGLGVDVRSVIYDVIKKCKLRRKSSEDQATFNQRIADDYMARPEFYFHREPVTVTSQDIDALKFELHQVNNEYKALIDTTVTSSMFGALITNLGVISTINPRWWPINDKNCNAYFRTCEYMRLCTQGLDRGTAVGYRHEALLHEELADED